MSEINVNEVELNGVKYVRKDSIQTNAMATPLEGKAYVIIRGQASGVFAGYLESRKDREVKLLKARRLWKWSGAASLSQLAIDGTSNPKDCMFPCETETHEVLDAIEVIACSEKAMVSIKSVPVWKK